MLDTEIKNSNAELVYKCFLLNVRSHRDYVCLEIENCPSRLDFPDSYGSIDSSQVVMPVLDIVRFNIKSPNSSIPFWYKKKLEVFAEGHQIFPKKYCSNCECLLEEESNQSKTDVSSADKVSMFSKTSDNVKSVGVLNAQVHCKTNEKKLESPSCSDTNIAACKNDDKVDNPHQIEDISIDNLSVKELFLIDRFKSKSEVLGVNDELSGYDIKSLSLPAGLSVKQSSEKYVQTRVSLGNREFSQEFEFNNDKSNTNQLLWQDFPVSLNPKFTKRTKDADDDTKFIHSTTQRFKHFDKNKKIKYWSLINSARQLMKMNQDVVELNTILKSLAVEKSFENNNLMSSLSPVNLILKLKKLNRSSSLYSFMHEFPDKKQWCDFEKYKIGYFDKLTNTFADIEGGQHKKMDDFSSELLDLNDSPSNESLMSMDTLFTLQKRMLKMMELFLRRNSTERSGAANKHFSDQRNTVVDTR